VIYHLINKLHSTLLIDEADNLGLGEDNILRAVLNSGHRKGGNIGCNHPPNAKEYKMAEHSQTSFGQLWSYEREGWVRRFFENWRAGLKRQRLKSYEKFAAMIDRHWDGIAAYCQPENKVSLGFVEGLNNKIRVIQRRAYGLRNEEYLRLKILTCMLPAL
jgi:Transposase